MAKPLRAPLYSGDVSAAAMMDEELTQLEQRVHQLLAAYRQARSDVRRAEAERDRLLEANNELRERIERIVARIRALELEQSDG
ncbi:MAG: hypothetical protein RLN67_00100 [Algiphilus sp.]